MPPQSFKGNSVFVMCVCGKDLIVCVCVASVGYLATLYCQVQVRGVWVSSVQSSL